jgi:hypothetical protein
VIVSPTYATTTEERQAIMPPTDSTTVNDEGPIQPNNADGGEETVAAPALNVAPGIEQAVEVTTTAEEPIIGPTDINAKTEAEVCLPSFRKLRD